jgi:hypothetical protein
LSVPPCTQALQLSLLQRYTRQLLGPTCTQLLPGLLLQDVAGSNAAAPAGSSLHMLHELQALAAAPPLCEHGQQPHAAAMLVALQQQQTALCQALQQVASDNGTQHQACAGAAGSSGSFFQQELSFSDPQQHQHQQQEQPGGERPNEQQPNEQQQQAGSREALTNLDGSDASVQRGGRARVSSNISSSGMDDDHTVLYDADVASYISDTDYANDYCEEFEVGLLVRVQKTWHWRGQQVLQRLPLQA